jgi:hypothetical protein
LCSKIAIKTDQQLVEETMRTITDDHMRQMMTTTKPYTVVILKTGPQYNETDSRDIIWEHARRNFELREKGLLSIVCPIRDGSEITGIGIFNASVEETQKIIDGDPGVKAGVFVYEIHPSRSFPGDNLPS